jgi:putative toxin-antitoxin system antitoxin component (TIGR02293 family)
MATVPKAATLEPTTPAGEYGYATLLGLRASDFPRLLEAVEAGFPFSVLERLRTATGLDADLLAQTHAIAPRTLTRRRQEGRFLPDESDRILRAARLFSRALQLFEGDRSAAASWLSTPQRGLGGAIPLHLGRTELGAREVETLIDRLEAGVFA